MDRVFSCSVESPRPHTQTRQKRVFSDIADEFWPLPPSPSDPLSHASEIGTGSPPSSSYGMMNSCSSEWKFQGFLQEGSIIDQSFPQALLIDSAANASSSTSTAHSPQLQQIPATSRNPNDNVTTSGAAAAAKAINIRPQNSAAVPPCKGSSVSNSFEQGSQVPSKGFVHNLPMVEEEARVPPGIPSLPAVQKKSATQARSTISGSEQSDDDEAEGEGEAETTRHGDPADVKRVRRMRSNRESARRSRSRRQAHLTELDTRVSQLKIEKTSLEDRLTDVRCKYNEVVIDNRVLKADVETLRAKVKMAEQTVKRLTGLDPLYQATSDMSRVSMQSFTGSRAAPSIDARAALPIHNGSSHNFYQSPSSAPIQPLDHPSPEQLGRHSANR
ncbi:unnamed protein product [Cuscuta europaea]|uniref:BZIP domain-containing protein n=1 Tax=Cuscuta europaea TaxID=41803 RepID=A0A9P0YM31_CUSEU|nr:unnamed protein product [Cuscuta europaea]